MSEESNPSFGRDSKEQMKNEELRWAKMFATTPVVEVKEPSKPKKSIVDLSKINPDMLKKVNDAQKILDEHEKKKKEGLNEPNTFSVDNSKESSGQHTQSIPNSLNEGFQKNIYNTTFNFP